jgi:hypothetical protein
LFLHKENQFGRVDWNLPECVEESSKAWARGSGLRTALRADAPVDSALTAVVKRLALQELDYVPMPAKVAAAVRRLWSAEIKDARRRPVYAPPK